MNDDCACYHKNLTDDDIACYELTADGSLWVHYRQCQEHPEHEHAVSPVYFARVDLTNDETAAVEAAAR